MDKKFLCKFCEKNWGDRIVTSDKIYQKYRNLNKCQKCRRSVYELDQIRIVGPFVIVIPVSQEMITKSGIIFPATLWKLWNVAQVAKLAEREIYTCFKVNKKGKQIGKIRTFTRPDVKIGDIVLFQKWAPRGYDLGRGNIYFIHYEDIEISFQKGTFIYPM